MCPVRLVHDNEFYFRSYRWYEKGHLPAAGAWLDQPAHWVQAMEIIGAISASVETEQLRELKNGARNR